MGQISIMPGDILPSKQGVIVLSGYGVSIAVERGHLVLSDGIGDERRNGRFSRVHKIKRLIVVGHSGFISFDAVRWLKDTSIHFVQMDYDSNVMLCDAWTIGERVALRRAQALAPFTETGNAVTRYLLEQKVHGQANVIALYDRQTSADIRQLHERIAH